MLINPIDNVKMLMQTVQNNNVIVYRVKVKVCCEEEQMDSSNSWRWLVSFRNLKQRKEQLIWFHLILFSPSLPETCLWPPILVDQKASPMTPLPQPCLWTLLLVDQTVNRFRLHPFFYPLPTNISVSNPPLLLRNWSNNIRGLTFLQFSSSSLPDLCLQPPVVLKGIDQWRNWGVGVALNGSS